MTTPKAQPAVYKLENRRTGEMYIGGTRNAQRRRRHHTYDLRLGKHRNPNLQDAINMGDKIDFIVLEYFDQNTADEYILNREQMWIDFLHPTYNRRNALPSLDTDRFPGKVRSLGTMLAHEQSQDEKDKRAKSVRKFWDTHPPKEISQEHRKAISDKLSGEGHFRYGTHIPDEMKAKLRDSNSKVEYTLTHPEYGPQTFRNLRRWCEEHHIGYGTMSDVARGVRDEWMGWTLVSRVVVP